MKRFSQFIDEQSSIEDLLEGKRGYSAMIKTTVIVLIMNFLSSVKKKKLPLLPPLP